MILINDNLIFYQIKQIFCQNQFEAIIGMQIEAI